MTRAEAAAFLRDLREPAPAPRKTRPEHIRVSVLFEPRPQDALRHDTGMYDTGMHDAGV